MYIDLYKDRMHPAELFGKQVLYSEQPIAREEVPEGWHCYDLCRTDRKPDQPLKLTDLAVVYRVGTVLSPQPLKKDAQGVLDYPFPFTGSKGGGRKGAEHRGRGIVRSENGALSEEKNNPRSGAKSQ